MKKSTRIGLYLLGAIILVALFAWLYTKYSHGASAENAQVSTYSFEDCPYTVISWNLENFGRAKTDESIATMAQVLKSADLVAAQEITAGKGFGAQAVAKLAAELSKTGAEWDYVVSNPTMPASPGVERYAFLFKKSHVSMNRDTAQLLSELENEIDREPFFGTFDFRGSKSARPLPVTMFSIHTVPTAKNPKREVEALAESTVLKDKSWSMRRGIFSGDFNLGPESTDPTFNALGYKGTIAEKTSLKQKLTKGSEYLFHQYDNIYVKNIHVCRSGAIDFVKERFSPVTDESLRKAREVSDHLPVFINFGASASLP